MGSRDTPEKVAWTRTVTADSILNNTIDLREYPHPYLAVMSMGWPSERVSKALKAAEMLAPFGWELLNVASVNDLAYAFLRRRQTGP